MFWKRVAEKLEEHQASRRKPFYLCNAVRGYVFNDIGADYLKAARDRLGLFQPRHGDGIPVVGWFFDKGDRILAAWFLYQMALTG